MDPGLLLHWHYLVFLVPCVLAAALLLLSSLRLGHHHGPHGAHSHAVVHSPAPVHAGGGHVGAGHTGGAAAHGSPAHGPTQGGVHPHPHGSGTGARPNASKTIVKSGDGLTERLASLLGLSRAPMPMVVEAFFLAWGLSGCLAVQILLGNAPSPTLAQVLPVMGIAAGFGIVGARLGAEVIGRVMPREESCAVSRDGLYGLTGKVAFRVSDTGGRIMVYDDYGSLHDEGCRVAPGHPPIERGRRAMVVDRDSYGNLLVEEIAE